MQITVSYPLRKELVVSSYSSLDEAIGTLSGIQDAWVDLSGYDTESLKLAAEKLGVEPLTLEDIATGKQRVKIEDYPEYLFAVSKGVHTVKDSEFEYAVDEIFIILFSRNIITFHSGPSQIISHVLETLKNRVKTMRREIKYTSRVLHQIFDFSVDSFYTALSDIENWLVSMRSEVLDFDSLKASDISDVKYLMSHISRARREMSELRIILTQHRDVVSLAERGTLKFVSVEMMSDFRDVYDHTFQLIETLDSYMLRTSDVRDLYFTLRSAFTDNILRLLTIVATIFLPLTFLTGFYGMNFTGGFFQPGSGNVEGFYFLVAVMVILAGSLLLLFRKRGWV